MRSSQFLISTLKETPADAEVISHQLMLRAGMVRKLASGLYNWLPLGLRVLRKIEAIVREEMDRSGAQELLMPVVQPAELWQESGRWEQYGAELARLQDRHQRDFCLGPTHEEVITDLVRNEIQSYKQLPVNFYQIQTKFRDEVRPRFGVMRAREFTMKDAYSFHLDDTSLEATYERMYQAYSTIFSRIGVDYRAVEADNGSIGGNASHEFHVLADSGEDAIAFSDSSDYAANVELAQALDNTRPTEASGAALEEVATPEVRSIDEVSSFLQIPPNELLKTLLVHAEEGADQPLVALVLRGDHQLNEIKAEKLEGVAAPLVMASEADIKAQTNCEAGFIGPIGLGLPVIADPAAAALGDFSCGANSTGFHYRHGNWQRDAQIAQVADIRCVVEGDPSPDGKGKLVIKRGIEVGHIFQLGKKYSEAMQATVLNESGKSEVMTMGCYGIGVSRVMAAAIEQNHDDNGIIWPAAIAPFQLALVPLNMQKSEAVADCTEQLYAQCLAAGVDVLMDDRNERPGVKFADIELIGIPWRVVIGDKSLQRGVLELVNRRNGEKQDVPVDGAIDTICALLAESSDATLA